MKNFFKKGLSISLATLAISSCMSLPSKAYPLPTRYISYAIRSSKLDPYKCTVHICNCIENDRKYIPFITHDYKLFIKCFYNSSVKVDEYKELYLHSKDKWRFLDYYLQGIIMEFNRTSENGLIACIEVIKDTAFTFLTKKLPYMNNITEKRKEKINNDILLILQSILAFYRHHCDNNYQKALSSNEILNKIRNEIKGKPYNSRIQDCKELMNEISDAGSKYKNFEGNLNWFRKPIVIANMFK